MSRWLVGSSSRSTSGEATSARASSTRRRQPPERLCNGRVGRQLQARHDHLDALFQPPTVQFLELVLQAAHLVERAGLPLRNLDRRVMVGGHEGAHVPEPFGHHLEDAGPGGERHILIQARAAHAGRSPHRALIGLELSCHDAQKRGLAAAVPADRRNSSAGFELQRDVVEQWHVAVGVAHMVQAEKGHEALGYWVGPGSRLHGRKRGLNSHVTRAR